eukprot:scaffold676_cov273-Pinguiococcus_pyrenoidosus.AAC.12
MLFLPSLDLSVFSVVTDTGPARLLAYHTSDADLRLGGHPLQPLSHSPMGRGIAAESEGASDFLSPRTNLEKDFADLVVIVQDLGGRLGQVAEAHRHGGVGEGRESLRRKRRRLGDLPSTPKASVWAAAAGIAPFEPRATTLRCAAAACDAGLKREEAPENPKLRGASGASGTCAEMCGERESATSQGYSC